jgi:multidrug efflux pump subunit AcrB
MALVLVLIVLFLTLNGRIAFMTALGIPVSVYGSFILMNYFGLTVNLITLFSFIIVLGIIVDDAIVITENIFRFMEMGYSPKEAAIKGTEQVYTPVLATIATNIVAFLPLTLIGGLTGKFMVSIPYVVTIALLVSLFEALIILPSHMAEFVRVDKDRNPEDNWREAWISPFRKFMLNLGAHCLRYRYLILTALIALVPLVLYASSLFPVKFFHMEDIKMFRINLRAPAGSSLDRTSDLVKDVERTITATVDEDNLRSYISTIGWTRSRLGDLRYAPERAQIEIELVDPTKRNLTGDEIIAKLRDNLLPFPRAEQIDFIKQQAGPPTGQPVEIELTGPDLERLRTLSDRVRNKLETRARELQEKYDLSSAPIYNIKDNYVQGKTELRVRPIPSETGRYGLSNQQVARTVNLAVGGLEASSFQSNNESIEVMVRLDPRFSKDPQRLKNLRIPIGQGKAVPLGEVAKLSLAPAPGAINRLGRERAVMISASVNKDLITGAQLNQQLEPFLTSLLDNKPNYSYNLGGEYEEQNQAYQNLSRAFVISLLIIYTILAGLFNSFLEPFVIVLAVPFSFIGVLGGLFVMGKAISFTAAMGTVALAGIAVNDALILLQFIDDHQSDSPSNPYFSILRAIRLRIRPVLLTTLTTIVGLVPIGFEIGLSGVESFLSPMAIALMYGLAAATFVTLLFVPMIYRILTEFRTLCFGLIGNLNSLIR